MRRILTIKTLLLFFNILLLAGFPAYISQGQTSNNTTEKSPYSFDVDLLAKNMFLSCELFEEGKNLYEQKEFQKARLKFQEALQKDQDNAKASQHLKLCEEALSRNLPKATSPTLMVSPNKLEIDQAEKPKDVQLLTDLLNRVETLEAKKSSNIKQDKETPSDISHTSIPNDPSERQHPELDSKITEDLQMTHKVKQSEFLMLQGNKYYENLDYEKAYEFYKKALEVLEQE
ncbi:MAG: hypothetical protein ABH869_03935 [Candidatus Omnitrophota bacterium]